MSAVKQVYAADVATCMPDGLTRRAALIEEIRAAINRHCAENGSNTPDHVLARYLTACLDSFNGAVNARDDWYGVKHRPGQNAAPESSQSHHPTEDGPHRA